MIFIKNCTTDLTGKDVKLTLEEQEKVAKLSLTIKEEEPIALVKTAVNGVCEALRKSMKYIASITNSDVSDTVSILDNKTSELAFFVKGKRTVLKETTTLPNTIGEYDEIMDGEKHYPRDMVVLIVPNYDENGGKLTHRLISDRRNLGAPTQTVEREKYSIIIMYVKYPIWANLKFAAYAYVKTEKEDGSTVVNTAFQLGTSTNKNLSKNQVIDVDPKIAIDYLEESFRILREKKNAATKQRPNTRNRANDRGDFKPRNKGNFGGGKPAYNKKGSNHGYNSKHGFNSSNTKSRNRFAK